MGKLLPSRITSMREYRGLSQADLAQVSGVGQAYISKLERNKAPNVAGIVVAKLARALETSTDYLLNLTDNPAPMPTANHPSLRDPGFAELADAWPDLPPIIQQSILNVIRTFLQVRAEKRSE